MRVLEPLPSGNGLRLTSEPVPITDWSVARRELRALVKKVIEVFPPAGHVANETSPSAESESRDVRATGDRASDAPPRVKHPLANLRKDRAFTDLASSIREFADGGRLVYVPNWGNWGDALIHRGTVQFLDHCGLDYVTMDRTEVERVAAAVATTGGKIEGAVLVNGGGGAWRSEKSGNRAFFSRVAPSFAKAVELPHTFEAPALALPGTDVLYVARDESLSRTTIPSAIFCHDMAFFLQLSSVTRPDPRGRLGVFMRQDSERHPDAVVLSRRFR